MRLLTLLLLITATQGFGQIKLDEMMTHRQMRQTGVDTLNYSQKMALEEWLNDHFVMKQGEGITSTNELFLSLNIDEGSYLELSDGRTYEIDPEDRMYSAFWITPFPIMLSQSDNNEYPIKITNLNSNTSVNGREVSTRELLKREKEKHSQQPPEEKAPQPEKKQEPQPKAPQPEKKQEPQPKAPRPQTKQLPKPKTTQPQEKPTQ